MAEQAPVVAVDDGSGPDSQEVLTVLSGIRDVTLIRQGDNRGIAAAVNVGCAYAVDSGATVLVTFDQDSRPSSDHVFRVLRGLRTDGLIRKLGIVGPGKVGGLVYRGSPVGRPNLKAVVEVIQSGLAMPTDVFQALGQYDEGLFIDGVDTEYCLRARERGFVVAVLEDLALEHTLGVGVDARFLRIGKFRPVATGHSAFRRYYMTRNRIVLLRRYGAGEFGWALTTIRRTLVGNLLAVTIERDRLSKALSIWLGLVDGFLGRSGRHPDRGYLSTTRLGRRES